MIFKKNLCCHIALFGLFFYPHFIQSSYKDFRDKKHLHVSTDKPVTIKSQSLLVADSIKIVQTLSCSKEHIIKKALYNNHYQELSRVLNASNSNMRLSADAQSQDNETLLIYACRSKKDMTTDPAIINLLLEKGADLFLSDNNGNTAFSIAQAQGNKKLIECFKKLSKKRAGAMNAPAQKSCRII